MSEMEGVWQTLRITVTGYQSLQYLHESHDLTSDVMINKSAF